MVRTADLRIILMIVIVNKMYEKGAKGVKFYLVFRFNGILRRIRGLGSFLLACPLYDFAFRALSSHRFV